MLFFTGFLRFFNLSLRSYHLYRNARYDRTAMMVFFSFPVGRISESVIVSNLAWSSRITSALLDFIRSVSSSVERHSHFPPPPPSLSLLRRYNPGKANVTVPHLLVLLSLHQLSNNRLFIFLDRLTPRF